VWLDHGEKMGEGDPRRVVDLYLTAVEKNEDEHLASTTAKAVASASAAPAVEEPVVAAASGEMKNMYEAVEGRWGTREIEITDVSFLDAQGEPSFVFHWGDPLAIRLTAVAHKPAEDFVFGIGIFNAEGVCCYGTNTYIEQMEPQRIEGEVTATFTIDSLELVEGTYKLDAAVHTCDGHQYDYHRLLYTFRVKSRVPDVGIYRPRHHWNFSGVVKFKEQP
jgi:hypothetical protein